MTIFPLSVFNVLGKKSMFGVTPILNNAISKSIFSDESNFTDFATLFSEFTAVTPEFNFRFISFSLNFL